MATKVQVASCFAKAKHDATGKVRKLSGLAYFVHPESVANRLALTGTSEEVVIAGYLHDTVEDAGVTLQEIQDQFGARVAELVAGCSEPDKGASWDERKLHTMEYLRSINDLEVLMVAVADKLDNISETHAYGGPGIWSKFNAPYEKQRWYYTALSEIFSAKIPDFPLTGEYRAMVEKVFA